MAFWATNQSRNGFLACRLIAEETVVLGCSHARTEDGVSNQAGWRTVTAAGGTPSAVGGVVIPPLSSAVA